MVKKFDFPCDFSGKKHLVTFYIGNPAIGIHPIAFQSKWLSSQKGGIVPKALVESLAKLKEIADQNKISFEELCGFVSEELEAAKVGLIEDKK